MEAELGRPLSDLELVYRRNDDRSDNRIENLVVRTRALPPGFDVDDLISLLVDRHRADLLAALDLDDATDAAAESSMRTDTPRDRVAAVLRDVLESTGLTQARAAVALGVSVSYLSKALNRRRPVSLPVFVRALDLAGLPLERIVRVELVRRHGMQGRTRP